MRRSNVTSRVQKLFFLLFLAVSFTGCGGSSPNSVPDPRPSTGPLPTPTPVGLELPAAGKIYLGALVNSSHDPQTIIPLETSIGRKLALNMHYYTWTTTFPLAAENSDISYGRIPVESWNCQPSNSLIASGAADALITTRALTVKAFGHPVFIRYLWDMNETVINHSRATCYDSATDNADGTFSAAQFVAAWQHMRAVFTKAGVTNAIWLWSPGSAGVDPTPYYPGDAYVDWIGIDAYDTTGGGFVPTFATIYAAVAPHNKPILIAETGEVSTLQPTFFQAAVPALQSNFPLVKGLMYFDEGTTSFNWQLTAATLPSFASLASNPYLSAMGSL